MHLQLHYTVSVECPAIHLQLSVFNDRWIDEIERTQEANMGAIYLSHTYII